LRLGLFYWGLKLDEWTRERDYQLRHWRNAGFSYELIARKFTALGFPCSKGSAIGRACRLGLIGLLDKKPKYQLDNHSQFKKPAVSAATFTRTLMQARAAAEVLSTPTVAAFTKSLLELDPDQCRYPEGEGADIRFCGEPQLAGSPYCPTHDALCYIKGRNS
jgi:hypothetical protein